MKVEDHQKFSKLDHRAAPSRQGEKHRRQFAPPGLPGHAPGGSHHVKTGENSRPTIGENSTPAHTPSGS